MPTVYAAPAAAAPAAPATAAAAPAAADHDGDVVNSPMVGTVYLQPEPGAPPFVRVGDSVAEGQTLLIIEAMKTMNPIPAPARRPHPGDAGRRRPAGRVRRAAGRHRVA